MRKYFSRIFLLLFLLSISVSCVTYYRVDDAGRPIPDSEVTRWSCDPAPGPEFRESGGCDRDYYAFGCLGPGTLGKQSDPYGDALRFRPPFIQRPIDPAAIQEGFLNDRFRVQSNPD
ncbi:MAG: hypothetical protein HY447_03490 [Candidatus Omnitrophica bacterium]|nr:hypothetical protein [Candidatus Omnitrophota bacterium]